MVRKTRGNVQKNNFCSLSSKIFYYHQKYLTSKQNFLLSKTFCCLVLLLFCIPGFVRPVVTTYIDLLWHIIAENDALDKNKKVCYQKHFWFAKNYGSLGHKMTIIEKKHQVLGKNGVF